MKFKSEFIEKYQKLFNEKFHEFIKGFSKPKTYGLRLNSLKCANFQYYPYLKKLLTPNPLVENGFYYDKKLEPGKHPYHHAGVYYIQDPSAMMVIENADIKENDIVFDMCAAPGGKSTHILSKLNHSGLLISNEINFKRAKILSENIERMGAKNTIIISADPLNLTSEFNGFFDKVIVDAPCSGEGMFRKNQEAVDDWSYEKVLKCATIQKKLIDCAYRLVKDEGIIIYATCTFAPEENEEVIEFIMNKYPNLELMPTIKTKAIENGLGKCIDCSRFYFHKFNGEGHFIAKLKKHEPTSTIPKTKTKSLQKATKNQIQLFREFCDKYLQNFTIDSEIYNFNQHLYTLNYQDIPNLDKINILRYGLYLGEIKKNRFEPSHALALALKPEQVKNIINFESESDEIISYLRGETIYYPGNKHYTLITVDGFPLGWVKQVNDVLKNYYPKGLRIKSL